MISISLQTALRQPSPSLGLASAGDESALPLGTGVRLDGGDVDGEVVHAEGLEEVLGLVVDLERGVGRDGEGRDLGDVLVLALTLLLLQTEGDASDRALLDTLHQVGGDCGGVDISDEQRGRETMDMGNIVNRRNHSQPEILFRRRFEGTDATSSMRRLLVLRVSADVQTSRVSGLAGRQDIPPYAPTRRYTDRTDHTPPAPSSFGPKSPVLTSSPHSVDAESASTGPDLAPQPHPLGPGPQSPSCPPDNCNSRARAPMAPSQPLEPSLYSLEVEGEAGVVLLDENAGSALHGLCPDTTLLCGTGTTARSE
jgi:hypothetical protein